MASTSTTQIPISVSSSTSTLWDVFLSFRGTDTRKGFTTYLYDALSSNGIRTFMDNPELHCGEIISHALPDAIWKSKIYIVVFSENYASSSWCLDELVEILRCFEGLKRTVIPVFYKIETSVVRHQKGSFETAFDKHKIRFALEMERVNDWLHALRTVADFSGKDVAETSGTPEVHIINEVVDAVLREINPKTFDVAKYPVGIESRVAEITPLLTSDTECVRYTGIWGMGGVGKTTLAQAVYNANFHRFEGSCFLADITNVFRRPRGPEGLQEQLIADVLNVKKTEINSMDQGKELIRQRISSKKILVVVDDVNDQEQLDCLGVGSYARGSLIILTTRHEDLLTTIGVEARYRYMLQQLDDAQSRELFNKHAFRDENPCDIFLVLSNEILNHVGGLPLAIEIFGSALCNKSETEWRRIIGKLKKVVNPKIQEKLVISFKYLVDRTLQEIFLDIACFFVGELRSDVVPILGSCYEDVDANIDLLQSRCLIKMDEDNAFWMHDLIREMGWEIARQGSDKNEVEKHSRISDWKDIYAVLDDKKGTEAIQCMVHHYAHRDSCNVTFDTKTFKRMPKLRFLKMKDVKLRGSFEHIFKNLTWLHWSDCPLKSLPSDFCPKELGILELPWSKITRWKLTKDLTNLKILDFSRGKLTTTPDFCRLPCLEKIDLSYTRLKKVDTTIGELKNLASLNLNGCRKLSGLPDSLCKLTALESLEIGDYCGLKTLPEELGNMKSLKRLEMGCPHISKLPDSIRCLTQLVELRLDNNKKIGTLGDIVCNFGSLEILEISWFVKIKELLPSNLQLPPSLRQLIARGCNSILQLPDLSNLNHLEELDLQSCIYLAVIDGLGELVSIKNLCLRYCSSILVLPDISNLKHLEELNLAGCRSLREFDGLEKRLPNISNLKQLRRLYLQDCSSLGEIDGFEELASILFLDLNGCDSSMVANTLTQSLFQKYSEFGNIVEVLVKKQDKPKWMSDSSLVCREVRIRVSHNFLGLLISLECHSDVTRWESHQFTYAVNNKINGWLPYSPGMAMVTVPKKNLIESHGVSDEDAKFQVTASCGYADHNAIYIGIHPLYRQSQESYITTFT